VYELGDKVVYPHLGAGTIVRKEVREVLGRRREYLTIQIPHAGLTITVPTERAHIAGLRPVIGEETVDQVIAVLRGGGTRMPTHWNRRFRHNHEKIKTGDVFELAEVVRNLSIQDLARGLSVFERQMFARAKRILASELMYARHLDAQEAAEFLETLLEEIGQRRALGAR